MAVFTKETVEHKLSRTFITYCLFFWFFSYYWFSADRKYITLGNPNAH